MIRNLWSVLRSVDISPFGLPLFFLSCFVVAILELISVAVIPLFVTILLKPEVLTNFITKHLGNLLPAAFSRLDMVIYVGLGLTLFLAVKAIIMLVLGLGQNRALVRYQANLSSVLVRSYLKWPYETHLQKNSAELVRNAISVPISIATSLLSFGVVATESLLVVLATIALISYNPIITLCAMALLGGVVGTLFMVFKRKLSQMGQETNLAAVETTKWANQTVRGLKEIRTANRGSYFLDHFLRHFTHFSQLTLDTQFVVQAPRLFMEFLAIATMIILAALLLKYGNPDDVLPTMALFGAASLRLIPSANRIWNAIAIIRSNITYVDIYLKDIANGEEVISASQQGEPLCLHQEITVSSLTYSYPGTDQPALKNIDLKIRPGQTVGIAGRSGAGKSTLLDILLGLHRADQGDVLVDGRSIWDNLHTWRHMIGYVPQQIFLLDDSVRRNVALGETDNKIDDARVIKALERANLMEVIDAHPDKLDASLGEGGARLSGGQRQRIGIARALYRNPAVLFLDEATSALDHETEQAIAETLRQLHGQVTIIIIAHHAATMSLCDTIFVLDQGTLSDVMTPGELQASSSILK